MTRGSADIAVEGVTKAYRGGKRALGGVSFTVAEGESLGVIGPNGAGKTTLFGCLLGLLRPDTGHVTIARLAPDDLFVRAHTGYVPERLEFDLTLTARQLLALRHELLGRPRSSRGAEVEAQLDEVGLVGEARARSLRTYSRGMLQRLGLAHALVGKPRWLFLDEPTLGIDPEGAAHLRALLGALKAQGVTTVINSHDLAHLERVCDRVLLLRDGLIAAVETLGGAAPTLRVVGRWALDVGSEVVQQAAASAGATVLAVEAREARFEVADEAASARLLLALVQAGVPVAWLERDGRRLERFFSPEDRP
jgi:ABC-2 type transport system ATP-binding protein